jgi:hypothetical protein
MSILTDQLAIAIERTRLQEETAKNTASMELALQAQTSRAWREYIARQSKERGYRFEGVEVRPLSDEDIRLLKEKADLSKPTVSVKPESFGCSASIPILVRNNLIGSIVLNFSTNELDKEILDLLEVASDRISFSLETARLYQDASVLASQEQQINLISGEIQQSNKLDAILQSTIRELGKALRVPRTFIQLGLPPTKENPGN